MVSRFGAFALFVLTLGLTTFFAPQRAVDEVGEMGPYLNGQFPDETPNAGGTSGVTYSVENAFRSLTFIDPVDMVEIPGANKWLMIGLQGHVWTFDNDPMTDEKDLVLDLSQNTISIDDGGMLGVVLHPEYGQEGSPNREYVYLFYRYTLGPEFIGGNNGTSGYVRLSRFNFPPGATSIDPASEYVMIQIFDRIDYHSGGDMFFGPDGFMYISVGDKGFNIDDYSQGYGVTQQIDRWLFGGILRIDVDMRGGSVSHPIRRQPEGEGSPPEGWPETFTRGYYIPSDNPWVNPDGSVLEEFWAIGTRSPHKMTLDPVTGEIWIGDVGAGTQEEISIASKGDNLQWPFMEGDVAGPIVKPTTLIGNEKRPVFAYGRSVGRAVIGGFVVRNEAARKYPDLAGKYIFGDHEVQNIWAIEKGSDGRATESQFLVNVDVEGVGVKDGLSSFVQGSDGTIYVLDLYAAKRDGGKIRKLVRRTGVVPNPPALLSSLGVFTDLESLDVADGILPYTVNSPLWSDHAAKRRWVAIPNDGAFDAIEEQVTFSSEKDWVFPPGTVFIKHFDLPTQPGSKAGDKKLETRFLVVTFDGAAYGVTYRWNEEGTEAYLIDDEETRDLTVVDDAGNAFEQTWSFPSRQQCMTCHNPVAGYSLGMKTRQLNGDLTYPSSGVTANQLDTWNALNIFSSDIGDPEQHPQLASMDAEHTSVEMRVRSYIDANCAYCHRPNGVEGAFDGRAQIPLYDQHMINAASESHASPAGSIVIKPGDAEGSDFYIRDISTGDNQMPPIGKSMVDEPYIEQLKQWIESLDEKVPETLSEGIYVVGSNHSHKRLTALRDGRVVQAAHTEEADQQWRFDHLANGKFRIQSEWTGLFLSTEHMRAHRGAAIVQKPWMASQDQYWYMDPVSDEEYLIRNAYNDLVLDVAVNSSAEGASVIAWTQKEEAGDNQLWAPVFTQAMSYASVYVSDLEWTSAFGGWGPVEKDQNNGGQGLNDGRPMTIGGNTYAKGLGVYATSEITYDLSEGLYNVFMSDIGVDDGTCELGDVVFTVYGDEVKMYESPLIKQEFDPVSIFIDIEGVNTLQLVVTDGDGDLNCDHANWADARVANIPPNSVYVSDLVWSEAQNGLGPVERDQNNGESTADDGQALSIDGTRFIKGLGVHAHSEITYTLNGDYVTITGNVGLDDAACESGSVVFEVHGDGVQLYQSTLLTKADGVQWFSADVEDVQDLKLIVTDGGDMSTCDMANWGELILIKSEEASSGDGGGTGTPVPVSTALTGNYPNPFSTTTTITYQLLSASDVRINVFDIQGRQVAVLYSGYQWAGYHQVNFDASHLASGVYFYRLELENEVYTGKMLLNK